MPGTNLRILARNILDEQGVVLTAAPAFVDGLDEQVLLEPTQRGVYARTTGAAGQVLSVNLAAAGVQRMNVVVLTRVYDAFDIYDDYTIQTTRYQAGSPSVALATDGPAVAFDFSQLHRIASVERPYMRGHRNVVQYMDVETDVESFSVDMQNDAVSADRYTEYTRMLAGEYVECEYDPPFGGARITYVGAGAIGRADDGTMHADVGYLARRLTIDAQFITDGDLPAFLALTQFMLAHKCEGFIDLYPGDMSAKGHEHRFPCRLMDPPEFNPHFVGLHSGTFVFEET